MSLWTDAAVHSQHSNIDRLTLTLEKNLAMSYLSGSGPSANSRTPAILPLRYTRRDCTLGDHTFGRGP